ncbi:MAG: hypothetical protein HUU37_00520 [Bdellovibrionales bacterium]|nr:hypothetical protein [Bdellovibrionales bacterium]
MQIFQSIILLLLLFGPLLVAGYAQFRPAKWPQVDPGGYPVFLGQYAGLCVLSAVVLFWTWNRSGMEYVFDLGPVSREFQLVLQVSRERMIWVLAFVVMQAAQAQLAYSDIWKNHEALDARAVRASLLAGFHLLGTLALLNERPMLSILFIESAVLMQHLICLGYDEGENRQDRVSYFKRAILVLLGILVTVILGSTGLFNADSLIMAGLLLYIFSLVYYKHPFTGWTRTGWFALVQVFALFVLWRMNLMESWAVDAGATSIIFGILSVGMLAWAGLSPGRLGNFFWYSVGLVSYQMFVISLAGGNDRVLLPVHALAVVALVQAQGSMHGGMGSSSSRADLWVARGSVLFSHLLAVCALPGAAMPRVLSRLENDTAGFAVFLLAVLLAGLSVGRLLLFSGERVIPREFLTNARAAALWVLLLIAASAVLAAGQFSGSTNYWMDWADERVRAPLLFVFGATLVGLLMGQLMERGIIRVLPRTNLPGGVDKLMPVVDPLAGRVNGFFSHVPGLMVQWLGDKIQRMVGALSLAWSAADERLFSETVWGGASSYAQSVSRLIRLAHGGGARQYVLYGLIGAALGGAVYVLVHG